jgi:hypothetical protein
MMGLGREELQYRVEEGMRGGYDGVALARYNDTSREVKGRFLQASIVSLVFPLTLTMHA